MDPSTPFPTRTHRIKAFGSKGIVWVDLVLAEGMSRIGRDEEDRAPTQDRQELPVGRGCSDGSTVSIPRTRTERRVR